VSIFRIQIKNKISGVHSKIIGIKKKYHDRWYYTIITVPVYKVFNMVFLFCMCWGIMHQVIFLLRNIKIWLIPNIFVLLVVDSYMLNILYGNFKRKLELTTRTAICEFSSKTIRHYGFILVIWNAQFREKLSTLYSDAKCSINIRRVWRYQSG
jgi:hypothetical protein